MINDPFLKLQFLQEFLKTTYQTFPEDLIVDLEEKDPVFYNQIRFAETESARLRAYIKSLQQEDQEMPSSPKSVQPSSSSTGLSAAIPPSPQQNRIQALKSTTIFTPLSSIVERGYDKPHKGINWAHYTNMLKLYTLIFLIQGPSTQQQQKDISDLSEAIEKVGNAKFKRKHLTAKEILSRHTGTYMIRGEEVVRALFAQKAKDFEAANSYLAPINNDLMNTKSENNYNQLQTVMRKAQIVYNILSSRYHN